MTVYVITSGEYSDYHICAVAIDREKAERLKKVYDASEWGGASIEEYETDGHNDKILDGYQLYTVLFNEGGIIVHTYADRDYHEGECVYMRNETCVGVVLYAKSLEAAEKIAAERRAKFLAENEGIA